MEKQLFGEYPAAKRVELLEDNADSKEEIGYMRRFTSEEMADMKDELSDLDIQLNDLEEDKLAAMQEFKDKMRPLQEEKKSILANLKNKSEFVRESCYKMCDFENAMVGFYNKDGELVESRQMRPEERQKRLFVGMAKTGTDDE